MAAGVLAGGILVFGQQIPEPRKAFGSSITGAFEGWYYNADGSRMWLLGYLNRNFGQALDVPIGPNNRIEPGGPTWGADAFPARSKLGHVHRSDPEGLQGNRHVHLDDCRQRAEHDDSPAREARLRRQPVQRRGGQEHATGDSPVRAGRADDSGTDCDRRQGDRPHRDRRCAARTAAVGDRRRQIPRAGTTRRCATRRRQCGSPGRRYRGPGTVTFDKPKPEFEKLPAGELPFSGKATTSAKFSEAGDYVLHVTANDLSGDGGGGEVCCWTTAMIKSR